MKWHHARRMDERTTVKVVASALVWHGDALLLLRRARDFEEVAQGRGLWEPPGGRVEVGETIVAALAREVREEAGIDLPPTAALVDVCNYVLRAGEVVSHRFHIVYAVALTTEPTLATDDEHDAHRWVRRAGDLAGLDMLPELRAVVIGQLRS